MTNVFLQHKIYITFTMHALKSFFNPFVLNAPFLYPLKTSENRKVCWCFQEEEKEYIANEWVKFYSKSNMHIFICIFVVNYIDFCMYFCLLILSITTFVKHLVPPFQINEGTYFISPSLYQFFCPSVFLF